MLGTKTKVLSKAKKGQAGPSVEIENPEDIIKARRNHIAERAQAKKRQVPEDDLQMIRGSDQHQRQIEQSERHVTKLKADSTELVTNILVGASDRELKRREETREGNRLRLEKLENEAKSNTELFNKIMDKWTEAKTKVIHQELRDDLSKQQELCSQYIENKNKLISELQQELKAKDDCSKEDRKREAEEVDLLIKRMQEQVSSLKKNYRKELNINEIFFSDERRDLLTASKNKLEQLRKKRSKNEQEYLLQRIKMFEEHEALLDRLRMESAEEYKKTKIKLDADVQRLSQNLQERKATYQLNQGKLDYNVQMLNKYKEEYVISKAQLLRYVTKQQARLINLKKNHAFQEKQSDEEIQALTNKYNLLMQQYKDIQKRIRLFAEADAKCYEDIWRMNEDKAKALLDRAVDLDAVIHEQVLDLTWSPFPLPFMDDSGSKQAQFTEQQEGARVLGKEDETERDTEHERSTLEDALSTESSMDCTTVRRLLELLCDELDFLVDSTADKLLSSTEDEQTLLKMDSIFSALGIKNEQDLNKMTQFLLKYNQPQTETNQAEKEYNLIHPNDLLRVFRAFTAQDCKKIPQEIPGHKSSAFALDWMKDSEVKAYWENIANVVPESKLKVWNALDAGLKKYHTELTKRSKLLTERQRLRQQNKDLCMLLHKYQNSVVN